MKIFLDSSFLIYLNTYNERREELEKLLEQIQNEKLYTDVLVLDEVIYICKKKYKIPYEETIKFLDELIGSIIEVLPITLEDYLLARLNIIKYNLKPSNAIHLAVMENNGIQAIVTEDKDFQKVPIRIIWI